LPIDVSGNLFVSNGEIGIYLGGNGAIEFADNVVVAGGKSGVAIAEQAAVQFIDNMISAQGSAVELDARAGATLQGNDNLLHGATFPSALRQSIANAQLDSFLQRADAAGSFSEVTQNLLAETSGQAETLDYSAYLAQLRSAAAGLETQVETFVGKSLYPAVIPPSASPFPVGYDDPTTFHQSLVDGSGNLTLTFRDVAVAGRGAALELYRTYRETEEWEGHLGKNWQSNLETSLLHQFKDSLWLRHQDGGRSKFIAKNGMFVPEIGLPVSQIQQKPDFTYTHKMANGRVDYFDANGLLMARGMGAGTTQQIERRSGKIAQVSEVSGRTLALGYQGQYLTSAEIAGMTTRYQYDNGLLTGVEDNAGRKTRLEYDQTGRLKAVTFVDGGRMEIKRNPEGQVSAIVGPGNMETKFVYETNLADGSYTSTATDSTGRTVRQTDTVAQEGAFSRNISKGTGDSLVQHVLSAAHGNLRLANNRADISATFDFDQNRLQLAATGMQTAGQIGFGAESPAAEFDGRGFPKQINWQGKLATPVYDDAGRLTQITTNDGAVDSFIYDASGLLETHTKSDGGSLKIERNLAGQPVQITDGSDVWTAKYNALGQPTNVSSNGMNWALDYDTAGRVVRFSQDGAQFDVEYDSAGNPNRFSGSDGSTIVITQNNKGAFHYTSSDGRDVKVGFGNDGQIESVVSGDETLLSVSRVDGRRALKDHRTGETFDLYAEQAELLGTPASLAGTGLMSGMIGPVTDFLSSALPATSDRNADRSAAPSSYETGVTLGNSAFSMPGAADRLGRAGRAVGRVLSILSYANHADAYVSGRRSGSQFAADTMAFTSGLLVPGNPLVWVAAAWNAGEALGRLAADHVIRVINDPNHPLSSLYQRVFNRSRQERSRHPCARTINCDCEGIEAGILNIGWKPDCRRCQAGLRQQCMREYQNHGDAGRAISSVGTCRSRCSVYGDNYTPRDP
ncbi:MAG: hypothetical protein HRU27_19240, partial [Rhizobiaceae bacterium]|nr:hypothetical protein [Rhizobiaceae bacterium]